MLKISLIYIDIISIILLFLRNKVKDNLKELKKFSTVGLNLGLCLLPLCTGPSPLLMKNCKKNSPPISSPKDLIKPEVGSIP